MTETLPSYQQLTEELAELRLRLGENAEILRAIRKGEVDAVLAQGPNGDQLFTLKGADDPYRVLIEEMNQGAVTLSADGSILYCNRRFCELLKTPLEEIVSLAFDAFVAPDERGAFAHLLHASLTDAIAGEITLCASDKTAVPLRLALGPLPAESSAAVCLVATDISESKQVETRLLMSEASLAEAQQSAQVGSWEWDAQTRQLSWSDELFRIYRHDRAGFVPTWESYAELVHPDDRAWVMQNVDRALHDRGFFNHDHRIIRADGTHGVIQARGRMVVDDAGETLKFVGTSQDVTERKRVEAELEDANRKLHDASRLAGMAEVASSVLHNVGNVLNSVNISATVLADGANKSKTGDLVRVVALLDQHAGDLGTFVGSDPQGKNLPGFLREISEQLTREQQSAIAELVSLRENIDHIKSIVAMQQSYGRVSGVTELLQVSDLLEDGLRLNASALVRHRVQIVREYQDVPAITVEKHKVLQILVNLMRNAKFACSESGLPDRQMTLRVSRDADAVKISVSDNGVGIAPENLTRIFSHGFTTRKDGHGFGLHSGVLAAQEMGGALRAESQGPGQGATFTLELPMAPSRDQ